MLNLVPFIGNVSQHGDNVGEKGSGKGDGEEQKRILPCYTITSSLSVFHVHSPAFRSSSATSVNFERLDEKSRPLSRTCGTATAQLLGHAQSAVTAVSSGDK